MLTSIDVIVFTNRFGTESYMLWYIYIHNIAVMLHLKHVQGHGTYKQQQQQIIRIGATANAAATMTIPPIIALVMLLGPTLSGGSGTSSGSHQ